MATPDPMTPMMGDEELGAECAPQECPAFHLWLGASLTGSRRRGLERLIEVGREINLWQAGLGEKPSGVILCGPKQIRGAR